MPKNYEHFIKPVPEVPDYAKNLNHFLITSVDELKDTFRKYESEHKIEQIAWDTETSSLNPEEGQIVGFSFSYDGVSGYYVPVNHIDVKLGKPALDYFYKMLQCSKLSILYNARFDLRFMEYSGYDMSVINFVDIFNWAWLADTNVSFPSLKDSERRYLGWLPPKFEETLGSYSNFMYVPAKDAYFYAAQDAIGTFALFPKLLPFYKESGAAGKLDNRVIYPIMKLEETVQPIDYKYLEDMESGLKAHLDELETKLYRLAGHHFKIGSSKDLTDLFIANGIDTGKRTKAGLMVTSLPELSKILMNTESELLSTLVEYKRQFKFWNAFVTRLIAIGKYQKPRFSYKLNAVPTGRLACGADGKNTYFSKINVQALPKPHPKFYYARRPENEEEANSEMCVCGWYFNTERGDGVVEGQDPYMNLRRAFIPDKDCYCVSIDMKAEELRIVANVYNEPTWIKAFTTGQDVHKMTSDLVFGPENYSKDTRKKAKIASFGLLYGSNVFGFHEKFPQMSLEECEEFIFKYKRALPNIFSGQKITQQQGKRTGTIYSYFGRPRRVKYYFSSSDAKMRAFGNRTCNNNPIQAAGGDILKIMFIRLWEKVFTKYPNIRFMSTVHDEINFSVPKSLMSEVIPILIECMTVKVPNWAVTMECSLSIGTTWGSLFPFVYNKDTGEITPEYEEGAVVNKSADKKQIDSYFEQLDNEDSDEELL